MITFLIVMLIIRLIRRLYDDETIVAKILARYPRLNEKELRKAIRKLRGVVNG
jgi:uncharacterized protein (DUF433 family)